MFTENYQHYWNRIWHFSLESIWKEYPQHLTPACLIMHPITNPYPQIQPNVEKRRWDYACFQTFQCCRLNGALAGLHLTLPIFTDTSLPTWFFLHPWNWTRSYSQFFQLRHVYSLFSAKATTLKNQATTTHEGISAKGKETNARHIYFTTTIDFLPLNSSEQRVKLRLGRSTSPMVIVSKRGLLLMMHWP